MHTTKGRTVRVTKVLLSSLHLASLVPACEQQGEEKAPSHPTEPLVPSRLPPGETGLTGAIQEAKIPVGKIKLSSLMGKQRSLEPSLKFSSQVNPLPLSDPLAHVSACSGFAQRKRGREDVCSGFRAAGFLDSAFALLFHAAGTVALVPPQAAVGWVKRVQRLQVTSPTAGRDSPGGCLQAAKLWLNCTSAPGPRKKMFMVFYL